MASVHMGAWQFGIVRSKKVWFGERTVGWPNPQYYRRNCYWPGAGSSRPHGLVEFGKRRMWYTNQTTVAAKREKLPARFSGRASTMRSAQDIPGEQFTQAGAMCEKNTAECEWHSRYSGQGWKGQLQAHSWTQAQKDVHMHGGGSKWKAPKGAHGIDYQFMGARIQSPFSTEVGGWSDQTAGKTLQVHSQRIWRCAVRPGFMIAATLVGVHNTRAGRDR